MHPIVRSIPGWLALALLAGGPLAAQTPTSGPPPVATAPFKHIAIAPGAGVWIGFAAQNRTRLERWRNFGFGTPAQSNADYGLNRLLLSADLHFGTVARFYVEGKSAVLTDRSLPGGRRAVDADDADLENAYLEVTARPRGTTLSTRVGRQELLFGRQRLVSPLDWANTRRTFEGLRATAVLHGWSLDAFLTHPVRVLKSSFNRSDGSVDFFGLYAQKKAGRLPATDLYWLALNRSNVTFNGTMGTEHRQTLGLRLSGKGPLEYDLEGAYQFGTIGSNISAVMFGSDLAHGWTTLPGHPRLHGGFDYASGDNSPGGDVGTFNQLFPLGHAFLGFIDVVGRQNIVAPNAGLGIAPVGGMVLDATLFRFIRPRAADALYNAGGGVERAPGVSVARGVGTELDVTSTYRIRSPVTILIGYSRLWPGAFIRLTGAARTIDFVYGSVQLSY